MLSFKVVKRVCVNLTAFMQASLLDKFCNRKASDCTFSDGLSSRLNSITIIEDRKIVPCFFFFSCQ